MKINVSPAAMLAALRKVGRVIVWNGPLPILHDYYFEVVDDILYVSGSNGDVMMRSTVSDAMVEHLSDRKCFAVEASILRRAFRKLDGDQVEIVVGKSQLTVKHSCGSFMLPLYDTPDEFPQPDKVDGDKFYQVSFEIPQLRGWFQRLSFAMTNDELRPVMNGIVFDFTKLNGLTLCASDGHKLVRIETPQKFEGVDAEFIMQRTVVSHLLTVMPKTGMVTLWFNRNKEFESSRILIDDGEELLTVWFKRIVGRYPNYQSVIPIDYIFDVTINRRKLIRSIDRASLFANPSSDLGTFVLNHADHAGKLYISAQDFDFSQEAYEVVDAEYSYASPFKMGFKLPSIMDCLKVINSEKVVFRLKDASRALIMKPEVQPTGETITILMMPMLVND